ncbi:MAG: hypothetical protein JWO94_599 [Verrucomicrobiaceae bacterium]|nr:hypothetical protein [Verrucomicrobiaceae bacterium]
MRNEEIQHRWESLTDRLAFRVNLGWWLDKWLPLTLASSLAGAVLLLLVRTLRLPHVGWYWEAVAGALGVTMIIARFMAGTLFETRQTSRVRLEDALGLHTRLTAATHGIGPWPAMPLSPVVLPVSWRWQRPAGVLAFAAGVLALAGFVPVPQPGNAKARVIEKPTAVKQVEAWVDQLRKDDAVKPEALDEIGKKIEELLKRPSDEWYEHASLEAAENLRDQTGKELQELGSNMEQAQGTLGTLAQMGDQLSDQAKQGLAGQLQQNLQGLRSGAMQAGGDLIKQLQGLDPKAMGGMSKEQLDKLQQRLKQNAEALRKALAEAPQFSFKEYPRKKKGKGQGEGDEDGKDGDGDPGRDGANRGRADAAFSVKKDETNLHSTRTEGMNPSLDPERVAPGDLLGTSDGRHSVDKNAVLGAAGGQINSAGEGGSAVWKESLVPAEREVLRRYFK